LLCPSTTVDEDAQANPRQWTFLRIVPLALSLRSGRGGGANKAGPASFITVCHKGPLEEGVMDWENRSLQPISSLHQLV